MIKNQYRKVGYKKPSIEKRTTTELKTLDLDKQINNVAGLNICVSLQPSPNHRKRCNS